MRTFVIVLLILAWLTPAQAAWDFSRHSIPIEDILSGGPPKDGIPALVKPAFITAGAAGRLLSADDRVIGVRLGDTVKAYPIRILNHHELVNDRAGERSILVSW